LSDILCGYRRGFSTQHALIALLEKWRSILDKKGFAGAILMDISKAFDCINHELLLAKLHAYGFSKNAVSLIRSYLKNRWQRVKINSSFSSWLELIKGVPQGSVLGPLLFNIFLNDLFWILETADVCNFTDDTTLYACDMCMETVLTQLEHDSLLAIEWFEANLMKLNADKCHLLMAGFKHEQVWAKIGNELIWESNEEKLLGVTLDRKFNFEKHVANICQRAHSKLSAIARYSKLLDFDKLKTLIKAFVESQFSYCPLAWMFHNRRMNKKINRLHERALRLLYSDDISTFHVLLDKSQEYTIHQRNIQTLAIEMFKAKHNVGPHLLEKIFIEREYNGPKLRTPTDFAVPKINTAHFGDDSLLCFGRKIWNLIPSTITNVDTLEDFKSQIRHWTPVACPCKLCKPFVRGLGYI
jgi:ribonuclease P/MRP protein subunit RPP40